MRWLEEERGLLKTPFSHDDRLAVVVGSPSSCAAAASFPAAAAATGDFGLEVILLLLLMPRTTDKKLLLLLPALQLTQANGRTDLAEKRREVRAWISGTQFHFHFQPM